MTPEHSTTQGDLQTELTHYVIVAMFKERSDRTKPGQSLNTSQVPRMTIIKATEPEGRSRRTRKRWISGEIEGLTLTPTGW